MKSCLLEGRKTAMANPIRVLLIDDDEDDHVLTLDLLTAIGRDRFRLDWVPSFDDGLAALRQREHDVYLLDYHLGEHNGLELTLDGRGRRRADRRGPGVVNG